MRRKVSLIATVLNEERSVGELLDSILAQARPPDEVVIVDGGSTDGTLDLLSRYQGALPLRILEEAGCAIGRGRNLAIAAAMGEIVAATDAGVRLDPAWLAELVRPFEVEPGASPDVVSGFFLPAPQSLFELAMGATVLPTLQEMDRANFLPSSRSVAFTKEAWHRVGGYPEWLDYCEDLVFDLKLREAGFSFARAPGAVVQFRPRSTLGAFFLQYYRYARGDGKADLWLGRHLLRYAAYGFALLALAEGGRVPFLWLLLFLGGAVYCYPPYRRLVGMAVGLSWSRKLLAAAYVPLIRVMGDLAKMVGYPVGLWWRWRKGAGRSKGGSGR